MENVSTRNHNKRLNIFESVWPSQAITTRNFPPSCRKCRRYHRLYSCWRRPLRPGQARRPSSSCGKTLTTWFVTQKTISIASLALFILLVDSTLCGPSHAVFQRTDNQYGRALELHHVKDDPPELLPNRLTAAVPSDRGSVPSFFHTGFEVLTTC